MISLFSTKYNENISIFSLYPSEREEVKEILEIIKKTEMGTNLLASFPENYKINIIPADSFRHGANKGSSIIEFNFRNLETKAKIVRDENGNIGAEDIPPIVNKVTDLFHELVHAFHNLNYDEIKKNTSSKIPDDCPFSNGEELLTITGKFGDQTCEFSENAFRKELGLDERVSHISFSPQKFPGSKSIQKQTNFLRSAAVLAPKDLKNHLNKIPNIDTALLLHHAATGYFEENLHTLIENGADVNYKKDDLSTPIFNAIAHNKIKNVEVLINNGAKLTEVNRNGLTPFFFAVMMGNLEIVKKLINHPDVDINYKIKNGSNALHYATDPEIVKLLIEKGIHLNVLDKDGSNALHATKNPKVVDLLMEHGVNIAQKNKFGRTPLFYVKELDTAIKLVEAGVNVNERDNNGNTPLHRITQPEVIRYLVENGADVNARNSSGKTPLQMAIAGGNLSRFQELLANGAEKSSLNLFEKAKLMRLQYNHFRNKLSVNMRITNIVYTK